MDLDQLRMALPADPAPTGTRFLLRTGRLSVLPIQDELAGINARWGMGLPLGINRDRANDLDPKALLTLDQDPSAHVPSIDEMLSWSQIGLVRLLLNLFSHRLVGSRRKGCGNMGDEVGERLFAGFGEMDFIPRPQGRALFASVSFRIVRRGDEQRGGRKVSGFSPSQMSVFFNEVVLDPDPTQDLDSGKLSQPSRSQRVKGSSQQVFAVCSNLLG